MLNPVVLLALLQVHHEFYKRPLAQLLSAHAIGAGGLGFKSRVANGSPPLQRSFGGVNVARALGRGDGPRHSLHASA